jgi:hypothetical protein
MKCRRNVGRSKQLDRKCRECFRGAENEEVESKVNNKE